MMHEPLIANPYGAAEWKAILPLVVVSLAALAVLLADLALPTAVRRNVSVGTAL